MNENDSEIEAEFNRLAGCAPAWGMKARRDSVVDNFTIKWGMTKDEVGELVDSYLQRNQRNLVKNQVQHVIQSVSEGEAVPGMQTASATGPIYRSILVCGEWLPNPSLGYQAYSAGQHWNGWECPHFTFESAKMLALDMHGLQYDSEKDEFVSIDPEELVGPMEERFPASVIDIEGVPTKVYAIGAWSWTWEPAETGHEAAH